MSHAGKRLHCLRPLSDAPGYAPTQLNAGRTRSAHPYSALNGSTQGTALHDGMRAEAVAAHPDMAIIAFRFSPATGLNGDR